MIRKNKYGAVLLSALAAAFIIPCTIYADELTAEDISSLSSTCIGYGQGRSCNEDNCPYGAVDFNNSYGKYNALAVTDNDKQICLSFDQGYENGFTDDILDTLKEKNVKAVFFLTGDYAMREQELVKRMISEGHTIGNHGMKHASLPSLSYDAAVEEISSLHDYVKETYGYEMTLFRPPCGEYSEQALAVADHLGYKTMLWSFAYCDWDVNNQPDRTEALERATEAAHSGAVYLLHSVSETNCDILPELIDNLRADGYELSVPVL